MFKDGKIEKTLKPSERKSITEFSSRFGTAPTYEEKMRNKRIVYAIIIIIGIIILISAGYFLTDVLIKITEIPYTPAIISHKEAVKWISSLTIQG